MQEKFDIEFMEHTINAVTQLANVMPEAIIAIKDLNSIHKYCSPYYLQLLKQPSDAVVGTPIIPNNNEMLCPEKVRKEDLEIIVNRKPKSTFRVLRFESEIKPVSLIKSPLINPQNNHVIGIIYQIFDFIGINFNQQLLGARNKIEQQNSIPNIKLTKREKLVIFLFLANLNSQEIVEVIYQLENKRISRSTIDYLFAERLFYKFNVHNRQALYEKCINLGFDKFIPYELLPKNTLPLEKMAIY